MSDRSKSTKIEKVALVPYELYSSNGSWNEPMRINRWFYRFL